MLRRKSEAGNVGVEVQGGSSEDIDTKPWTEIHERGTQADIWGRVCSRQRAQQVQRPWGRSLPRMLDQQSVNSVVPAEWREVNRQTAEAREVGRPDHKELLWRCRLYLYEVEVLWRLLKGGDVFHFLWLCNKWPQVYQLKTTLIHYLIISEGQESCTF